MAAHTQDRREGRRRNRTGKRRNYGWAPYWFPMTAFYVIVTLDGYLPDAAGPTLLALRALVPGALVLWYARRGDYPELRDYRPTPVGFALDVGVGLLGAVLWVAPFVLFASLRPDEPGFDPEQLGSSHVWLAVALRAIGYAAVTPFVEELFVRSWLLRYVDVFDRARDFRKEPIGRFRWRSFLVVTGWLVFTHVRWEWGVMLVWALLTMAWFYHRKHLAPLVLVHAVTNGSILLFVLLADGHLRDASGAPIPFWFLL